MTKDGDGLVEYFNKSLMRRLIVRRFVLARAGIEYRPDFIYWLEYLKVMAN